MAGLWCHQARQPLRRRSSCQLSKELTNPARLPLPSPLPPGKGNISGFSMFLPWMLSHCHRSILPILVSHRQGSLSMFSLEF